MAKKNKSNWDNLEPQKSSAAQFITYVASVGESYEKYELRYENENIWMSQKMLAAVYGVDLRTISYHVNKIF
ncbi:MAG: cell filamentation protein Fic, partial [Kiritimatiellia bacterium]|nr:cell filamentation protein Fic [Kiritimatiellia bacterium]